MNVIVSNENKGLLNSLDIDVIKTIDGEFTVEEITSTFSNFFFNRMFFDITSLKGYKDISNIQKLSINLDMEKVIFLLPNELMTDKNYLSKLISMGIYNFANSKESIMYLYNHPNTYKDVAQYHQLSEQPSEESEEKKNRLFKPEQPIEETYQRSSKVIGFKNLTKEAGATTLIYMLKKELSKKDYVVAIEVNKNDFGFFNEKDMYSVNNTNLLAALNKFSNANAVLVDINNGNIASCDEIVYIIEPSIIKLNKMMMINKDIFEKVYGKKIILNRSLLTPKDVKDFEFESHSQILFNVPPLNERIDNSDIIEQLIEALELKK